MQLDLTKAVQSIRDLVTGFFALLPYLLIALLVYALFHVGAHFARRFITSVARRRARHQSVGLVLGRLTQGALMLLGLLVALVIAVPSFKPGQLLQLLGIGGVAIGFAFRDILQNFLAGILILLTEPFRIGDQIIVAGYEGTVEDIETRATAIRTYDGRRVVIPNATLFNESVTVNTAFGQRRLQYDVGIGFGDDVERASALIREALAGVEGVLAEPAPEALMMGIADCSVTIRARWWIAPPRRADAIASTDRGLRAIYAACKANGIDLPFPTTTVLWHDQTDEFDGDRATQREGWPLPAGRSVRPRFRPEPAAE